MTNSDRARLARELHDGIAQDLVGVGYSLDLLLANPETSKDARSQLRTLRFTITELIDKVRKEIFYLHQPSDFTLAQSIQSAAQEHCKDHVLKLSIDEVPLVFNSDLSYEIERITQEILRNVGQHAKAETVSISLGRKGEFIELCIGDDGIGGAEIADGHFGIQSIRDRAAAINGMLEIKSDANGTSYLLRIPLAGTSNE